MDNGINAINNMLGSVPNNLGMSTGIQNNTDSSVVQNDSDNEDVSLDNLSEEEKDKILRAFKAGRDAADNYYKAEVEPKIIKRMELYKADKQ